MRSLGCCNTYHKEHATIASKTVVITYSAQYAATERCDTSCQLYRGQARHREEPRHPITWSTMDNSAHSRLGYAPPPPHTPTPSSLTALAASEDICPVRTYFATQFPSLNVQIPPDCARHPNDCVKSNFTCLCGLTNNLGDNEYFDSGCVHLGCTLPSARKGQLYLHTGEWED